MAAFSASDLFWIEYAQREIFRTYGHVTTVGRKSLDKYGFCGTVTSAAEFDVASYATATNPRETVLTSNLIDSISSDSVGDTNIPIVVEGMTRSGDEYTFVSQTINTNASDGQTRVALVTPLAECTRVRGDTVGNIWVYEDTLIVAGKPVDETKIHNQLVTGERASLKAGTAIASTNYYLMTYKWAIPGRTGGSTALSMRMRIATLGDPVLGDNEVDVKPWSASLGQAPEGPSHPPFRIVRPNSRIQMTAQSSSGTATPVYSGFNGIFLDIDPDRKVLSSHRSKLFI